MPYYGNEYYRNFLSYMPLREQDDMAVPEGIENVTEVKSLSEKNILYLDKSCQLSEEYDFDLVLVISPFSKGAETKQKYYNALAEYAREKDVPMIEGNKMYRALKMDGSTDFGTGDHLTVSGARKFTEYLSGYLREHYDLQDHRNDSYYLRWERNSDYMNREYYNDVDQETEQGDV